MATSRDGIHAKKYNTQEIELVLLNQKPISEVIPPFSTLSNEITLHIFSYLSLQELLIVQRASKNFKKIAGDNKLFKTKFALHYPHIYPRYNYPDIHYQDVFKKVLQERDKIVKLTKEEEELFILVRENKNSFTKIIANKNFPLVLLLKGDADGMSLLQHMVKVGGYEEVLEKIYQLHAPQKTDDQICWAILCNQLSEAEEFLQALRNEVFYVLTNAQLIRVFSLAAKNGSFEIISLLMEKTERSTPLRTRLTYLFANEQNNKQRKGLSILQQLKKINGVTLLLDQLYTETYNGAILAWGGNQGDHLDPATQDKVLLLAIAYEKLEAIKRHWLPAKRCGMMYLENALQTWNLEIIDFLLSHKGPEDLFFPPSVLDSGDIEMAKLFHKHGAKINLLDENACFFIPFLEKLYSDKTPSAKLIFLYEKKSDNRLSLKNYFIYRLNVMINDLLLKNLRENNPFYGTKNLNQINISQLTEDQQFLFLYEISSYRDKELLEYFVTVGLNINAQRATTGETILHVAYIQAIYNLNLFSKEINCGELMDWPHWLLKHGANSSVQMRVKINKTNNDEDGDELFHNKSAAELYEELREKVRAWHNKKGEKINNKKIDEIANAAFAWQMDPVSGVVMTIITLPIIHFKAGLQLTLNSTVSAFRGMQMFTLSHPTIQHTNTQPPEIVEPEEGKTEQELNECSPVIEDDHNTNSISENSSQTMLFEMPVTLFSMRSQIKPRELDSEFCRFTPEPQ